MCCETVRSYHGGGGCSGTAPAEPWRGAAGEVAAVLRVYAALRLRPAGASQGLPTERCARDGGKVSFLPVSSMRVSTGCRCRLASPGPSFRRPGVQQVVHLSTVRAQMHHPICRSPGPAKKRQIQGAPLLRTTPTAAMQWPAEAAAAGPRRHQGPSPNRRSPSSSCSPCGQGPGGAAGRSYQASNPWRRACGSEDRSLLRRPSSAASRPSAACPRRGRTRRRRRRPRARGRTGGWRARCGRSRRRWRPAQTPLPARS
jgi:hypothetical protein